jgi:hypothetical protein
VAKKENFLTGAGAFQIRLKEFYGTDYPADMGYHPPALEIPRLSRISEAEQEMILTGNAKKLYGR